MLYMADAVQYGVTHVEVAAGKVDFCAKCVFSVGELTVFHTLEKG